MKKVVLFITALPFSILLSACVKENKTKVVDRTNNIPSAPSIPVTSKIPTELLSRAINLSIEVAALEDYTNGVFANEADAFQPGAAC
jgi:hypothetical protein